MDATTEATIEVAPGTTTVEIDLVANGRGTTLRFKHAGFKSAEAAQSHGHGWDHYLERLPIAASGGDPGTDPWTLPGGFEQLAASLEAEATARQ